MLRADDLAPARDLALQALDGLDDNPQGLCGVKLAEWTWPGPFSRNVMGERKHLEKLTIEAVHDDFADRYRPDHALLSLAGDIDPETAFEEAQRLFADWPAVDRPAVEVTPPPGRQRHIEHDSEQTHIGLAYETVPETADDYYLARLAVECLSGGMSGRLFHHIREERGLCYSVMASYVGLAGPEVPGEPLARIMGYAGTSNDRAQATLDAFFHELDRLRDGVTDDELRRAKIGLKSATVRSGESTTARASAMAHDWAVRGRLRTLDEVVNAVDGVDLDAVNAWLATHPATGFTVVTIGPEPLEIATAGTQHDKEAKVRKD
jgi:predicted Zn-dependent peptidase